MIRRRAERVASLPAPEKLPLRSMTYLKNTKATLPSLYLMSKRFFKNWIISSD